ncbi:hypothetical protein CEXT_792431, partial [Caerostris extrusa]
MRRGSVTTGSARTRKRDRAVRQGPRKGPVPQSLGVRRRQEGPLQQGPVGDRQGQRQDGPRTGQAQEQ